MGARSIWGELSPWILIAIVPPAAIAEFAPPASQALMAQITAGIDHAEAHGWIELDTHTLEPTDRRIFTTFPTDNTDATAQE